MTSPTQQTTGDHSNPSDVVKPSQPADASPKPSAPETEPKEPITHTPPKEASGSNSGFRKAQ